MFWMALPLLLAAGSAGEPMSCETATLSQMAKAHPFYINGEEITFGEAKYARYGLPRVLLNSDLVIVGEYYGVPVGADASQPDDREVIYLLHDGETCTYQPYLVK